MKLDLSFPSAFGVVLAPELPGGPEAVDVVYYPAGSTHGGSAGLLLRIEPDGCPSWIAAFPAHGVNRFSGVFNSPSPRRLFVIDHGIGYLIDAYTRAVTALEPVGIVGTIMAVESSLALFWNPTCVSAYGKEGRHWISGRLSFDGLAIDRVTADKVEGTAFDARDGSHPKFVLDLATGRHSGGIGDAL